MALRILCARDDCPECKGTGKYTDRSFESMCGGTSPVPDETRICPCVRTLTLEEALGERAKNQGV